MTPSEKYLKPVDNVGDATLHITIPPTKPNESPRCFIAEIYDLRPVLQPNGTTLEVPHAPYSFAATVFIERRFKHGYKQLSRKNTYHPIYEIPLTDLSVHLVNKAWIGKKVINDAARPFFNSIWLREYKADENAKRVAKWRETGEIPTNPWFNEQDKKLQDKGISLNPYQKVAAYNSCMSRAYGFFCDPGTGKTCMMIRKLDYVIEHSSSERVTITLILCPRNVRSNWRGELQKFSTNTDKMHIIELQGPNPMQRLFNLYKEIGEAGDKHIVIISGYETAVQTQKMFEIFEFDLCILDESQNISNYGTKRTKTLLENRAKFKNVLIATGTPIRNSPFDTFPQFEFLGEGYSGADSLNSYKQFYGNYEQGFNGQVRLDGFRNIPLMQERVAKHCFVIRKEEALPFLPQLTEGTLSCELSDEQAIVYRSVMDDLYAQIESYGPEPDSLTVQNLLVQALRLAEITSGYAKLDSGAINRFDPNPKLELLIHHLLGAKDNGDDEECAGVLADPNRKAIVWCCFQQNIHTIRARLELEGIKTVIYYGDMKDEDKEYSKNQFNCDPETRVIVGTAASGGVGLNLVGFDPYNPDKYTTNCTDVVYFSSNWSYDKRAQSMQRAHRYITRVPVHVTELLCERTIDLDIRDRLLEKKEMDLTLQDIKGILKNIFSRSLK